MNILHTPENKTKIVLNFTDTQQIKKLWRELQGGELQNIFNEKQGVDETKVVGLQLSDQHIFNTVQYLLKQNLVSYNKNRARAKWRIASVFASPTVAEEGPKVLHMHDGSIIIGLLLLLVMNGIRGGIGYGLTHGTQRLYENKIAKDGGIKVFYQQLLDIIDAHKNGDTELEIGYEQDLLFDVNGNPLRE